MAAKRTGNPVPTFTNLDKVYWPDDGYTKADLIAYYVEVAPVMVPHLRDRPCTMNRHPNGIAGASFFQQDTTRQPPPDWVKTVTLGSGPGRRDIRFLLCQDAPTLAYLANLGCIEINVWNSRVDAVDRPDYLILDLDPVDVPFTQVVEAAQVVRKLLEKGCGECFCKTSGKRGLHVYVPLGARYTHDQARQFAQVLAQVAHRQLPTTTSLARMPAQRRNLVYLDYLQNGRGKTMAAAYSVRPVPGAWVSTPLLWKEVKKNLDPSRFTMKTMPRRLEKLGDVWQGMFGAGADLVDSLSKLKAWPLQA